MANLFDDFDLDVQKTIGGNAGADVAPEYTDDITCFITQNTGCASQCIPCRPTEIFPCVTISDYTMCNCQTTMCNTTQWSVAICAD